MTAARSASVLTWLATCTVVAAVQFLVVRSCSYDVWPLMAYAFYLVLHVYLPGLVAMYAVKRRPVSLTQSIALGVPTGFAIEIFSFLAVSAGDGRDGWRAMPVVWVAIAALIYTRRGEGVLRLRLTRHHAGIALALAILVLLTTLAAVSHMFAESPLVGGLPQRPIFHDWVYLVSRAATIKNLWPLEDPSLAGVALQYHYFLLVHVAGASAATGLEVTQVLLRMAMLPLGMVLVVQAYALGRMMSRSAWGGVLAALLTVSASELGFHPQANESVFLGRFIRWLHVSPTFYFGMIYFGALLLAIARWRQVSRPTAWHVAWLALLAAAATGAKGTVVPVTLAALGVWIAWEWLTTRRLPWRMAVAGLCGGGAFLAVYFAAMSTWGTGAAKFSLGDVFSVSEFWGQNFPIWKAWLEQSVPPGLAGAAAGVACGTVIVAGTLGVRALAFPFLITSHAPSERWLARWLGASFLVGGGMGMSLKLDADSELYIFLLIRLPSAVLAAALIVRVSRQAVTWWRGRLPATGAGCPAWLASGWKRVSVGALTVAILVALGTQVFTAVRRTVPGLRDWVVNARYTVVDEEIRQLEEALVWVRKNTERNAILVASAFTPENMKKDHWGALDGTLQGVHFYYSALSERRVLVEGPHYALHPEQVTRRMALTAEVLKRNEPPTAEEFGGGPVYLVIDRALQGAVSPSWAASSRIFSNPRIDLFRLPHENTAPGAAYVSQ